MQQAYVIFRRLRKIAKATSKCVIFVCLSARMQELDSHWTDIYEI
jgi:hypothetical protein